MRTIIATICPKLPPLPWEPTSYVRNELIESPKYPQLPTTVIPVDPMVKGRPGILQNDWRLVMNADALFLDGLNDHLYKIARQYGLQIYAPLYDQSKDEDLFASMGEKSSKPDDDGDLFGGTAAPEVDLFGGGADLFAATPAEPNLFG